MTDRRALFGFAGVALLAFGTFSPLVSLPIVGSMNYFLNGKGDGVFILGYAALALLFTAIKKYKLLWIPAILAIGQLSYALMTFSQKLSEAADSLEGNIFGQGLASSIHLDWAWIVLFAGAISLVVSAVLKIPAKSTPE